ncbi:c-type cytochrome [bacterium]|nr:c-type cytochrome [bacterium]
MINHLSTRVLRRLARPSLAAGLVFGFAATSLFAADLTVGNLAVKEGFKADLIYKVPEDTQGSWVSMTVDPKGRLITSDQYGALYRITPPEPGAPDDSIKVEELNVKIGHAQGLLYAFDSLYVMVNDDRPYQRGLYRVRDTNGDDQFDEVKLLRKLDGGGEHGPHAILLSPDGKSITLVIGDQTKITDLAGSKVPEIWGEDHLLPRLWDGNGFMRGVLGPGGSIYRADPDGKNWELQAVGFRNEYDAAYNHQGELFAYDADMEWDMNTPWYRPTRVNHVVSGAEFGWRSGAGKWPAYYADSLGAVYDIGPGSPTGVTFGYGAKFPAKYQEALFICDWSYGKLYALQLEPDGASYKATAEEFISGQPLALTDIVINPKDGAMYFTVGGRRTQSALYRVTYTGNESTKPARVSRAGARARRTRHELEKFHGHQDPDAVKTAWKQLDNKDRNIRYAARVAIEWQPVSEWQDRALSETNPDRAIEGIIALARVTGRDEEHRSAESPQPNPALQGRMFDTLNRIDWAKLDNRQRLDLLRAYTLALTRHGRPDAVRSEALRKKFEGLFPGDTPEQDIELAQFLVYFQAPSAAKTLMAKLEAAGSMQEQLNYARTLRVLRAGWTPALREEYFRWFLKAAAYKGGASLAGFLRDIKKDAVDTLSDQEKVALQPILDAKPDIKNPMELLAARSFVKEWTMNDWANVSASDLKGRNFQRGRQLFGAVACSSCHRYNGDGGAVGPDLSGVAGRFSPHDLLESIIQPSKEISDQYGMVVVFKKNGDFVTGRVANMSGDNLNIAENMLMPGDFTNVKRGDVEKIERSKVSPMPEGLLNSLNHDEVLDLVAFLMSRGDPNNKMFK